MKCQNFSSYFASLQSLHPGLIEKLDCTMWFWALSCTMNFDTLDVYPIVGVNRAIHEQTRVLTGPCAGGRNLFTLLHYFPSVSNPSERNRCFVSLHQIKQGFHFMKRKC